MTEGKKVLILHCSDSDIKSHDSIDVIREWHLERGFNDVGYHFFIRKDGTIEKGRSLTTNGAHCKGLNSKSWGVCMHGKSGDFTQEQYKALTSLIIELSDDLCDIGQHSDYSKNKPHCAGVNDSVIRYYQKIIGYYDVA